MELLVVITLIGILIALLLPAVQAARESARRLQCTNNLKQIAMACLNHEQTQGCFPTGGWGISWVGDPDRGFSKHQPGGWIYNILPYIEQQTLHDLGAGQSDSVKKTAILTLIHTSLATLNCPTRRSCKLYPNGVRPIYNAGGVSNTGPDYLVARADYAANVGSVVNQFSQSGPTSLSGESSYVFSCDTVTTPSNGVVFQRSQVKAADVRDGASNTVLVGEKYLDPNNYATGADGGDDESMYVGYGEDMYRSGYGYPPAQDQPSNISDHSFGSAHPNGCNIAFCDGSVQVISYSINGVVFSYLCNRADGKAISANKY